ncbi:MAG TPA: RHS repeat-associated core domain-containing protein [Thermoanaerobaculia bacterium]|nr:RHS repeat-associated core domain-containing protein [Thermoanaerobaculia bacterium]
MKTSRLPSPTLLLPALLLAAASAGPLLANSWCGNPIPPCDPANPVSTCYIPSPPDPRCEPEECGKCNKSPCYVSSGVFVKTFHDLSLPTAGFSLAALRRYESSHMIDGPTGFGWTSGLAARLYYTTYLFAAPSTYRREADVTMPSGVRYRFVANGDGTFTPPSGRHDTLVRNGDGSFDLTLQRSSAILHFAANGSLLSMTDRFGNALNLTYDANGRLQQVADAAGSGRYLRVTWGADGRIGGVQDSAGRQVVYAYDNRGVMTSFTDAANRTFTYFYYPGRFTPLLQFVKDPWNRNALAVGYDSYDRVLGYNEDGEDYFYTYAYNNNPNQTAKSDSFNDTWVFTYGAGGLVSDVTPPAGAGSAPSHTDYYPDGSYRQEIDEVGVVTSYAYDAMGRLTTATKDAQGPSAINYQISYAPQLPDDPTAVLAVNPATGQIDSNWTSRRYDYYPAGSPAPGALHHVYRVESDGTTLDLQATLTYDTKGRITEISDAAGSAWDYAYDAQGNLSTVQLPSNNDAGTRPSITYGYDAAGRATSRTDALGNTTRYTYDNLGRITSRQLPALSGSSLDFTTTITYDDFDVASNLVFTDVKDPNGNVRRYGRDEKGHLVKAIDAVGNATVLTYTHGLLTSITDPNQNVTRYWYDSLRRLSTLLPPEGGQEVFTYYPDGMVATAKDRKGNTTTYAYDSLKRLVAKTLQDSTGLTYTYTGQRLTSIADTTVAPSETSTLDFDSSFRLRRVTQGTRGALSYTYNSDDSVASYAVTGGPTATYSYFPDGQLKTINWSPVSGSFGFHYLLTGPLQSISFPNSQNRTYSYDNQMRLTGVVNDLLGASLATYTYGYDLDNASGTYIRLGQRSSMTASAGLGQAGNVTRYYYDKNYRLTRVDYPSAPPFLGETDSWSFDALGNITSFVQNGMARPFTYFKNGTNPLNGQRLQSDGTRTFAYDADGNLASATSSAGTFNFTSDLEDHLKAISGAASAAYTYDYSGRRTAKSSGGASASYLYDGPDLIQEQGASPADYLFGPNLDQPLATQRGVNTYYYLADGTGSVTGLTTAAGTLVQAYQYDATGNLRTSTNAVANPFGYTGREFGEAGLLYYRARYYDPAIGRFTAEDPIGLRGGDVNLYAYAGGDPVNQTDPSGLTRTPAKGPPNTWEWIPNPEQPGDGQWRHYGPEGLPDQDIDYGHDHGKGDPHSHDWDWGKKPVRQPGRPEANPRPKPEDPNSPKFCPYQPHNPNPDQPWQLPDIPPPPPWLAPVLGGAIIVGCIVCPECCLPVLAF